jgi:asparagine synthase (glutamine-hydrolysing)
MSALAGAIWTADTAPLSRDELASMLSALAGRGDGPIDAFELPVRPGLAHVPIPGVALGCRGHLGAPDQGRVIVLRDGALACAFDGELDNRVELRRRVDGLGCVLRTCADAEIVLRLFENEGPDCFVHVRGPFAAAVWDADHRRLVLARDRFGQKPLVYHAASGRLVLASGLRAILALPGFQAAIDPGALDEYLTYGYVPHPHTILRGVHKLPPGYVAIHRDGKLSFQKYWEPDFATVRRGAARQYQRDLREVLAVAIAHQTPGDGPLGVWLRGGVPSKTIAQLASATAPGRVRTFSLGLAGDPYIPAARHLAERLELPYHRLSWEEPGREALELLATVLDEPVADPGLWTRWSFFRQAAEQVEAVIEPAGSDELLAAYPRHVALLTWSDRVPSWLRRLISPRAAWKAEEAQFRRRALPLDRQRDFLSVISIFDEPARAGLYQEERLAQLPGDPIDFLRASFARLPGREALASFGFVDLVTDLPGRQLAALDMAAGGVACRLPFLDREVAELLIAMPSSLKGRRGLGLLACACLPRGAAGVSRRHHEEILAPAATWLRGPLSCALRDLVLDSGASCRELFAADALESLVETHVGGRADHGRRLWALLVLELWLRRHVPSLHATSVAAAAEQADAQP